MKTIEPNFLKSWVLLTFMIFGFYSNSNATHIAGADLTYQCLGGNQYEVELVIYRDCAGINVSPNEDISVISQSLGANFTFQVNLINNTGQEITNPCNSNPSICDGGSAVGIQEWIYRGTVTLPLAATDWVFSLGEMRETTLLPLLILQQIHLEHPIFQVLQDLILMLKQHLTT